MRHDPLVTLARLWNRFRPEQKEDNPAHDISYVHNQSKKQLLGRGAFWASSSMSHSPSSWTSVAVWVWTILVACAKSLLAFLGPVGK